MEQLMNQYLCPFPLIVFFPQFVINIKIIFIFNIFIIVDLFTNNDLINFKYIKMQDSIQLSDNQQPVDANILISPENYKLSKFKLGSNTGSQQSLAYSNSTIQKDHLNIASPNINVHNFEHPHFKFNSQTRIRKPTKDQDGSIFQRKEIKLQIQPPSDKMERKTIDKVQLTKLSRKNKQLENAFQLEAIVTEELRAKVSVLTEMLQHKIKDLGLYELLKLKNTSKDIKNIDIFVEMKCMRKTLNQKQVSIEKLKNQVNVLNNQIQLLRQRKNNDSLNKSNNSERDNMGQLQELRQEKESLFNYIQQLKQESQQRQEHTVQLEKQIQRILQKYNRMQEQRPKLIKEILEKQNKNKQLEDENMSLKMTISLIEVKQQELIAQHQTELTKLQKLFKDQIKSQKKNNLRDGSNQTVSAHQNQIIMAELNLLKTQRDHYLKEYRKKIEETSELYELKLKMSQ